MSEFRTHQEMNAVYQQRHRQGLSGQPYVLQYATDQQVLVFFGSSHSNDPADEQWPVLDAKWQVFAGHDNPNKILLFERQGTDVSGESRETALKKYSESGLSLWLARQADIPAESPEPDRVEEVEYLKQTYRIPEIITYYFGRHMLQWLTQGQRLAPDWRHYAADTLQRYATLGCWDNEELTLDQVLTWFKEATGKEFDPHDKQTLYNLSDPSQSAIASASGQYRDVRLFKAIQDKWQSGYDVFVVYGSGHAIVLEPAIEQLIKGRS